MFTVQEESSNKYISPGLHSDIEITDLRWVEGDGNYAPKMEITIMNSENQTLTDSFSFSENAKKYSELKITHIWNSFYETSKLKDIAERCGDDMEMFTNEIGRYLIGQKFSNFKVSGKEIQGKDGKKNWIKGCIGFPNFASGLAKTRTLTFDPNNNYDINRLPATEPSMPSMKKW